MVDSGTTNARAISAVVSPPTARSVSATWEDAVSAGWQQRNSRVSVSSPSRGGQPGRARVGQPRVGAREHGRRSRQVVGVLAPAPRRLAAQDVGEPPGGDRQQPGARVLRRPGGGPLHRRVDQRLLYRVLAAVEPVVAAHEHAEDLRRELAQQVLGVQRDAHRMTAVRRRPCRRQSRGTPRAGSARPPSAGGRPRARRRRSRALAARCRRRSGTSWPGTPWFPGTGRR